jgi:hypothetical protein
MNETAASTVVGTMRCPYCGTIPHLAGICPTIKAMEYYPDGTTKRVEFKMPADYSPMSGMPSQ